VTIHGFPLPSALPEPVDDGACDHLVGLTMPRVTLTSTSNRAVDVGALGRGRTVLYCYPMTEVPGVPLPHGWDFIPGARGCTPQACGFRDYHDELAQLGVAVFGCSTQGLEYQQEMATRLHLPFDVLSDADYLLCNSLRLPTFDVAGDGNLMHLIKRLTLVICDSTIEACFYPVFPSDQSAQISIEWLRANPIR
jgi:peroxiredoxin